MSAVCRHMDIWKICQDLLGSCEPKALEAQFLQWLASTSKPDMTYGIVESLLSMTPEWGAESAEADQRIRSHSPWQDPGLPVIGSMKVIRVTGVKQAGKHFHGVLLKFLEHTARLSSDPRGPQWQGPLRSPARNSAARGHKWQLFSVIKDFGQDE